MILTTDYFRRSADDIFVYDPQRGIGCVGPRVIVDTPVRDLPRAFIPRSMAEDPEYLLVRADEIAWKRLRCRHDFEYWGINCATIKHKTEARDVRLLLNFPQRRTLACLETQRLAGSPIRIIILKARQWGGSTLIQMYMAWIQSCHRRNWHSLICAHVKDTSAALRGMYTKLLANYPEELWEGDAKAEFKGFERSINIREICGRGCRVTIGSSENQDAVRGSDYAMAHLSETAFWPATPSRTPEDFIRAVCGAVNLMPYTLIAIESTANGAGNFFHSEWLRCREAKGDKMPVFVPWYEIDFYRFTPKAPEAFVASLSEAEETLWNRGLDLSRIYWYRLKCAEYSTPRHMAAEFPASDVEAFMPGENAVFDQAKIDALRDGCTITPSIGEITSGRFIPDPTGNLSLWSPVEKGTQYIVAVDVGGRTSRADWSVIAVLALRSTGPHEIVAQWRGHVDHDILADNAIEIARYFNTALLAIESNSLEGSESQAEPNLFVLSRMAKNYENMYRRTAYDTASHTFTQKVGFHTNRATKSLLIATLIRALRTGAYIERDPEACNELSDYEQRPNGSYGARAGRHDDILITRAIALHLAEDARTTTVPASMPDQLYW